MNTEERRILLKYWLLASSKRMYVFAVISAILVFFSFFFTAITMATGFTLESGVLVFGLFVTAAYTVYINVLEPFRLRSIASKICEDHFTPIGESPLLENMTMRVMSLLEQKYRFKLLKRKKENFTVFDQVESILILDDLQNI